MFGNNKITLGSSRRRDGFSKKKIFFLLLAILLIFLSIWQMPISQTDVSEDIALPKPTTIK